MSRVFDDFDDLEAWAENCSLRTGYKSRKGVRPAGHRNCGIKTLHLRGIEHARLHSNKKVKVTLAGKADA